MNLIVGLFVALTWAQELELKVTVSKRQLEFRAFDEHGDVIRDLTASDLNLTIDGHESSIDVLLSPSDYPVSSDKDARHRFRVVLLFQKDLTGARSASLMKSYQQLQPHIQDLVRDASVAVFSFRSHLKQHTDFTSDINQLQQALLHMLGQAEMPPASEPRHTKEDLENWKDSATIEQALKALATSLATIEGDKVILFIGWGVGEFTPAGIRYSPDYYAARDLLIRSQISVFMLDYSQADYHSLEEGLKLLATDSGGDYARLNEFGQREIGRFLTMSLPGYQLLFDEPTQLGKGRIKLKLKSRKGRLIYPRWLTMAQTESGTD